MLVHYEGELNRNMHPQLIQKNSFTHWSIHLGCHLLAQLDSPTINGQGEQHLH
jgi:hypothetical protein